MNKLPNKSIRKKEWGSEMKRSLIVNYNNGLEPTELEIKKVASVKSENSFIYFEKIKGEWRLTFSDDIAKSFSAIKSFDILRENKVPNLSEKDLKESMEFRSSQ